ncbi:MAG: hypothetical protein EOM70_12530 [Clostridia bacterium]|nr:hypothetical protein [Clostridia bacterium]
MNPDKMALNRLEDLARQADQHDYPTHTGFLTPVEQTEAAAFLRTRKIAHVLLSGYEGAERCVCVFLPAGWTAAEIEADSFLTALRIKPAVHRGLGGRSDAPLGHRDYLGSLLGLGIRRDQIGDILVDDGQAIALVLASIVPLIQLELSSVGSRSVTIERVPLVGLAAPVQDQNLIRITAASLRFDKIAAAGFNVSRNDMAEWIRAGQVQLNWRPETRPDRLLSIGDVISLRGYGRIRLKEETGKSRKDRHILVIEKW